MAEEHNRRAWPVPELLVERYLLQDLPPETMDRLRRLEAEDPAFAERVRLLSAESEAIRLQYPPARMAAEIEEKAGVNRKSTGSWLGWLVPVLTIAFVMWMIRPLPQPADPIEEGTAQAEDTRAKGGDPALRIYREGEAPELLSSGARAAAGDVLQLAYIAGEHAHGVILSIDGAGAVSLHWPPESAGTTALDGGGERRLEKAWALDDAPGYERFFFITSSLPIDVDTVLSAARKLASSGRAADAATLDLPPDLKQQSLLLRKP